MILLCKTDDNHYKQPPHFAFRAGQGFFSLIGFVYCLLSIPGFVLLMLKYN
jgi:hypothetical protein